MAAVGRTLLSEPGPCREPAGPGLRRGPGEFIGEVEVGRHAVQAHGPLQLEFPRDVSVEPSGLVAIARVVRRASAHIVVDQFVEVGAECLVAGGQLEDPGGDRAAALVAGAFEAAGEDLGQPADE